MESNIKLSDGEQIIKIFYPKFRFGFDKFFKRFCLIITDKRVAYKGLVKIFDNEIIYSDISNVSIESTPGGINPCLKISRKGGPYFTEVFFRIISDLFRFIPDFGSQYSIGCNWLSSDEITWTYNFINEKIK